MFYVVGRSHYPWWVSVQISSLASSLIIFIKYGVLFGVVIRVVALILTVGLWCYTIILEAISGNHSYVMVKALKLTFMMFIGSEVMFFVGIFWCYFDSALSPSINIGCQWPPVGIVAINPWGIPFFNTVVLLRRGSSLTWAHHSLLLKRDALPGMAITVALAFVFEVAQYVEYRDATFSISDGIYGRIFYFSTGFHGLHVMVGHLFLLFNIARIWLCHFTRTHHVSLHCAIVYWHFVDVV